MTGRRSISIDDDGGSAGSAQSVPDPETGVPRAGGAPAAASDPHGAYARSEAAAPLRPAAEDPLVVATERDTYLDALQRLKAEFENYRRRTQRELMDADARARTSVLAEFIPILENLERALNAAEHHEEGKVLGGVRMTHGLFLELLRREGVEIVDPLGALFDPQTQEAMLFQPSQDPEGTVTAVLERGYVLGDRVLRPAKVAVSAGPAEGSGE